jgi:hypothetical protein
MNRLISWVNQGTNAKLGHLSALKLFFTKTGVPEQQILLAMARSYKY